MKNVKFVFYLNVVRFTTHVSYLFHIPHLLEKEDLMFEMFRGIHSRTYTNMQTFKGSYYVEASIKIFKCIMRLVNK